MPKIICHMIASVDGRLYPDRWTPGPENADISASYESAADSFNAAGWIVGRTTMAEYAASISQKAPALLRNDGKVPEVFVGDRQDRPLAIVFDPKGKLHYEESGLPTGEHLVAVLSPKVCEAYLEELRQVGVSYVFEDEQHPIAGALQQIEKNFNAPVLLLEGGGIINGAFLKAGLIDELSFLIYPAIDGLAGVSSIVSWPGKEGEKPADSQKLEFISSTTLAGGIVWLRYAVTKA